MVIKFDVTDGLKFIEILKFEGNLKNHRILKFIEILRFEPRNLENSRRLKETEIYQFLRFW